MGWQVVWNNFDYFLWGAWPNGPLGGLAMSILLSIGGIFGAFWLGLGAGLMRLSKRLWIAWPAIVYIEVVRGIPLLLVIFWFYFLSPVLFGAPLPEAQSALISFIIFTSAYVAEIVRAGVLSLPKGQMEAARGSGLSQVQAMSFVILPQALRNMIPSFVNQFVSLIKDTSLAAIIGVNELLRTGQQVMNRDYVTTEIFVTIAIMYFIVCYALTEASRMLERQMSRYQARNR
ncbi:amino acid ABC transporter permease [Desulfocurvibacter africanus]|uniref:amino acid ABC transporter permease n=1 Tax=Desulfocurvibacter africanus TaxID=873 RepID=UPI0003FF9812|nr:amino acid ABC transporter permease [Desulfocurvibacter africanus]